MKIAICGLIKSENIGEQFIARSLEYLIRTEAEKIKPGIDIEFTEVDLLGRNDEIIECTGKYKKRVLNYYHYSERGINTERVFLKLKDMVKNSDSLFVRNALSRMRHMIWSHGMNYRKRMEEFFEDRLAGVDFIVVDGAGLLEYDWNEYHWPLFLISRYAEKHGVDVVYNAIGRAGHFDERDFLSTILKRALQSDRVKYVSARDSVETVQLCAGESKEVKLLADAAFWMKETYGIGQKEDADKIGIGIIRGNALTGYGVEFGTARWVELFCDIARELDKRGYKYEFFTNGLPGDWKLGRKVLKTLELPDEYLVERPLTDIELCDTISGYKALITCRMHSSIAAFTLGIPSVIMSWNDKVDKLMEMIGYPDRVIKLENFNGPFIVDKMEKALEEGVSEDKVGVLKDKALESVDDYIDLIIETDTEDADSVVCEDPDKCEEDTVRDSEN